jgi:hypothetical protein
VCGCAPPRDNTQRSTKRNCQLHPPRQRQKGRVSCLGKIQQIAGARDAVKDVINDSFAQEEKLTRAAKKKTEEEVEKSGALLQT